MSNRIELEQISENEVEVVLPPETPMEMVTQLIKGLNQRGLIEDLSKSTLSVRYFARPTDKANTVADQLIKSLTKLTKSDDELPYWHPKSQFANQKRVREMEIAERRAKNGIKQPSNVSTAPEPMLAPDAAPKMPAPVSTAPPVTPAAPSFPKMFDNTPAAMNTAGGTGRRYATIPDPVNKREHVEGCQCDKCLEMEKSGYGPKGAGLYNPNDNARRKANNVGDSVGEGPNVNVKSYSTKPGQLSTKDQVNLATRIQHAANKKQPVKQFTPEEIEAENKKRGLKKAWGQHLPFPSAEEEIMRLAKNQAPSGEEASAQQLAALMSGKNMLGENVHPAVKAMMAPPPPQPTNEQLFGHLVVSEEMAKAKEQEWSGSLNNFFAEASKPISKRFASEAEEMAYWASIKIDMPEDKGPGY